MRNIGLLLTKDDHYTLEMCMKYHVTFCDAIYALDGSVDAGKTHDILNRFDQVKGYFHDESFFMPPRRGDGIRNQILPEIFSKEGPKPFWITLLHGDEIYNEDPRPVIKKGEELFCDVITWEVVNFYWHKSQAKHYEPTLGNIEEQQYWYSLPGWTKVRQFLMQEGLGWDSLDGGTECPMGNRHGVPKVLDSRAFIKHYPFGAPFRLIQSKIMDGMNGKRLLQVAFSWVLSATCFADICVEKLPTVLDIIPQSYPHNFNVTPLPRKYS